ncbi:MAG: glycosyltransferase [Planctomycetes bacterium]|nr:glycosyltransferase [Planctomycetota bacterium]
MYQSVSIIIPTGGRPTKLAKCLAALSRQELPADVSLEVIVALDGGDAVEFDIPRDSPPHSRFLRLPRLGVAAARNAAIDVARGDLLIFSNDDTYPRRDWVREHLVGQDRRAAPGMLLGETRWITWPNPTVFDGLLRDTSMIFFYNKMKGGQSYGFRHFWTCNASVPMSMVRAIGGFNARIRPVFFEDCEFAFRIEQKFGDRVYFHPGAVNVHDHRITWDDYSNRERLLGRMAVRLAHANADCFEAIYGSAQVQTLAGEFGRWLEMDKGDHERTENALRAWFDRPLDEIKNWQALRELMYVTHLPLKRRLFRDAFIEETQRDLAGESPKESQASAITTAL